MPVVAYHITFGTYGTRLQLGARPKVARKQDAPISITFQWEPEPAKLKYPQVVLTRPQMLFIEATIPKLCERGGFRYITCAASADHFEQIVDTTHEAEDIRTKLRRWLGQSLTERFPREPDESPIWWGESGSIKAIHSEEDLENAKRYVTDQRATFF
jgi:hypothetical protein